MAMKGWRRIGIILSVIWFLGFGVYLWHEAEENNLRPLNARWDSCLLTFRMAEHDLDESVRGRGPTEEWAKKWFAINEQRNKCEANAKLEWESTRSYSTQLALVLVIDLVTIVLGWLIVWGCVALGRWVHRGFTPL